MKPGPLCHKCPLVNAPGPVWGQGNPNAKLVFIGQNPGNTEIEEDGPFKGGSGKVLNMGLMRVGISRERNFVTNVVKCYVKPGDPVPKGAAECCKPLLELELEQVRARTYVTLGKEAFQALVPEKELYLTSGFQAKKNPRSWLIGTPYIKGSWTILPTYHPANLMRTGFKDSYLFDLDLRKARRFGDGVAEIYEEHFNYNPTRAEVEEYIKDCIASGNVGLDIETPESAIAEEGDLVGQVTPIDVIGISARGGEAVGIPPDMFPLLSPLFEHSTPRVNLFTFNAGFDLFHIRKRFRLTGIRSFDLMLALHRLYSEVRPKDLGMGLRIFTDLPWHKNLMRSQPTVYNGRDTYGALVGGLRAWEQLREMRMEELFFNLTMPLVDVVEDIRLTGVRINQLEEGKCYLKLDSYLQAYEKKWNELIPMYSWSSPKQLKELFLGKLGLPPFEMYDQVKKVKRITTNDDAMEFYATRHKCATAVFVQKLRGLKKTRDFFQLSSPDSRAHTTYKIHGQAGHRLQAKEPNVMQIPEEMEIASGEVMYPREIVLPDDDDSVIITGDFSQIEFLIYAKQAGCTKVLEAYNRGEYMYGLFYEKIFDKPFFQEGMPRQKVHIAKTVQPWELLVAKSFPLGFIYGRQATGMTTPMVNAVKANWIFNMLDKELMPEVRPFHERVLADAERNHYVRDPFGHIRRFPNPKGSRNEVLAFFGQTPAVGVICQNALIPFKEGLKPYNARLMFSVHDSVVISCKKSTALECAPYVQSTMEMPIPQLGGFFIRAELKIGARNWSDLEGLNKYADRIRTTATVQANA